jgi:hypothetical protein
MKIILFIVFNLSFQSFLTQANDSKLSATYHLANTRSYPKAFEVEWVKLEELKSGKIKLSFEQHPYLGNTKTIGPSYKDVNIFQSKAQIKNKQVELNGKFGDMKCKILESSMICSIKYLKKYKDELIEHKSQVITAIKADQKISAMDKEIYIKHYEYFSSDPIGQLIVWGDFSNLLKN